MSETDVPLGGADVTRADGPVGREDRTAWFDQEGLRPAWWSNGPGDTYGWHQHTYAKVLFCQEGSIVFHLRDGDVELLAGDRLDLAPGTEHAATVGGSGVVCVEAER